MSSDTGQLAHQIPNLDSHILCSRTLGLANRGRMPVWGGLGRSKAVVTWRDETVEKQASARRSGAARPCI